MAKNPCLDCIDKYEKSKQRKRNAKKRQKQKEEATKPAPVVRQMYLPPQQRFIPSHYTAGKPPNLTDLLVVLRVNEALREQQTRPTLDTLERTPTEVKPSKPKTANEAISQVAENYVDIAKSIPQIVRQTLAGTIGAPFIFLGGKESSPTILDGDLTTPQQKTERTLEKSKPKTPNEAVSDALDLFGITARTGPGVVRDIATQLPRDIRTTTTAPFSFASDVLGPIASAPFKFVGNVSSAVASFAESAAEPEPSLQRTAPATGGDTPAIQFVAGTGRVLESSPVEQGANPLPSVFTATPPPASLIDDLQRGGLDEEKRRVAELLASPTPRFVPKPTAELVGEPPQLLPQGASMLTPETEIADALGGQQTVLDLALRPRVDVPLVPDPLALYPEGETLLTPEEEASFEDAVGEDEPVVTVEGIPEPTISEELPLGDVPPTIETSASLVDGRGAEELPLTPASLTRNEGSLSPRTLTRQTTEELAATVEDVDVPDLSAIQLQKEYDKQKREDEKIRRREAQLAKIADENEREARKAQIEEGKRLKAETTRLKKEEAQRKKAEAELAKRVSRQPTELQIPGVTKRDVANTPKLETFFGGVGLQTRFQQQRGLTPARPAPEGGLERGSAPARLEGVPQVPTFTQPTTERTFKPFEGGGV